MKPISSSISTSIKGSVAIPGDKSISHRSLIISSLAIGKTTINGILKGKDIISTKIALEKMGVNIYEKEDNFEVCGVGSGGLLEPNDILDLGNSGTSARLLIGLISSHKMTATLTGDASLRKRPMKRVTEHLVRIGANIALKKELFPPIKIKGTGKNGIILNMK